MSSWNTDLNIEYLSATYRQAHLERLWRLSSCMFCLYVIQNNPSGGGEKNAAEIKQVWIPPIKILRC